MELALLREEIVMPSLLLIKAMLHSVLKISMMMLAFLALFGFAVAMFVVLFGFAVFVRPRRLRRNGSFLNHCWSFSTFSRLRGWQRSWQC